LLPNGTEDFTKDLQWNKFYLLSALTQYMISQILCPAQGQALKGQVRSEVVGGWFKKHSLGRSLFPQTGEDFRYSIWDLRIRIHLLLHAH
jgi:hypothetical protein